MVTIERDERAAKRLEEFKRYSEEFKKPGYREVGAILKDLGKLLDNAILGPEGQRTLTRAEERDAARLIMGLAPALASDAEFLKLVYDTWLQRPGYPVHRQLGEYVSLLEDSGRELWQFSRYVYDRKLSSVIDELSYALNIMGTGIVNSIGPSHPFPSFNIETAIRLLEKTAKEIAF